MGEKLRAGIMWMKGAADMRESRVVKYVAAFADGYARPIACNPHFEDEVPSCYEDDFGEFQAADSSEEEQSDSD
jgi:hypothetical protein